MCFLPLTGNAHGSKLQYVCLPECMCVCVRANTDWEEEGPLGPCPFAVILIQLYTSCSSSPSPTSIIFSCSPRAEDKQHSALNSQWLPSIFLFLSPSSSELLFWKKKTKKKLNAALHHMAKKVQQKQLTNKRSIKYHNICFISIYQSMHFFDQAGKISPTT